MLIKALLLTAAVAMVPVIELRGAIPIGMANGLPFWPAFLAGVVGNLIPVPFLILFVRKVFAFLKKKSKRLSAFVEKLEKRAESKSELIHRYELIGLTILVAIPLPGTGAWTGALVAAMMDLRMKSAFPAIALGVVIAGVIVSVISYGAATLFG